MSTVKLFMLFVCTYMYMLSVLMTNYCLFLFEQSKLFEGLEEDSGLSPDTFVPRKNIKKLVIKNKSFAEVCVCFLIDLSNNLIYEVFAFLILNIVCYQSFFLC